MSSSPQTTPLPPQALGAESAPPAAKAQEVAGYFGKRHLPAGATPMRLLGVDYLHLPTSDGGDLYVTQHGIYLLEHLQLKNWYEEAYFAEHRERLKGTSTVYRIKTREVRGRSLDLVVKYCRVGEDVPRDTFTFDRFAETEFNSPYEEFSLVMEMRANTTGVIRTNRPVAIYVPSRRLKLWQTGRDTSRIERKKTKFRDVELDILRQYILVYEWVKGVSADVALENVIPDEADRQAVVSDLTRGVAQDLKKCGYQVADHKPAHIILRPRPDHTVLKDRQGRYVYALVDFELLTRTPDHEQIVQTQRRTTYLQHQKNRFAQRRLVDYPEHLRPVTILGTDYVFGHAESTQGHLWVVGHNPDLFDYFLPERWRRTPHKKLSETNETYYTLTKDSINLVWKFSRVGEQPEMIDGDAASLERVRYGYNSPFEEFAIALELTRKGLDTIYPRAIYMSGIESGRAGLYVLDSSRFERLQDLVTENGNPLFLPTHNYLTIWGFWNGLDEMLASKDEAYCVGVDLARAVQRGLVTAETSREVMERANRRLREAGFLDLDPRPSHFLLSQRHDKSLILDADGTPSLRRCNFAMIKRLG